jgi:hypothetical protein
MYEVSTIEIAGKSWIRYKRQSATEPQKNHRFFLHCTCQTLEYHGTVDVRADSVGLYEHHECFPEVTEKMECNIKSWMRSQQQSYAVQKVASAEKTKQDPSLENVLDSFVVLQSKLDLSFRSIVSQEFQDFCHSLIDLGKAHPSQSTDSLMPKIGRPQFMKRHKSLSTKKQTAMLERLRGCTVCMTFDATKIISTHYLVSFLTNPRTPDPILCSLTSNLSTQEQYARFVAKSLASLKEKEITVGSLCTDGLIAQVNAISGRYEGFEKDFPFSKIILFRISFSS